MIANPMGTLRASMLTPEIIRRKSTNPEEALKTLICGGDYTQEKLEALMSRPDVTGFNALKLLKMASESNMMFWQFRELYIEKFIKKGTREDCLRSALMTIHLWIHFIPSAYEIKIVEAEKILPETARIFVALVNNWPEYKSLAKLLEDIKEIIDSYNAESTFPGDTKAPFEFDFDNYVENEMRTYVLPYVGRILLSMFREYGYYNNPEDLYALATTDYLGHEQYAAPLYIKSIESTFTLDDIGIFCRERGDYMERFLLAKENEVVRNRFHSLCAEAKAADFLSMIGSYSSYAGFNLFENKEYKKFSLEERIDFLEPALAKLKTDYKGKQSELLRVIINDPEWNNPERTLSELTSLALRKKPIFSYSESWLFIKMEAVIVRRIHGDSIAFYENKNQAFLEKVSRREFIRDSDYPLDFQEPGLALATLDIIKKIGDKYLSRESSWPATHTKWVLKKTYEKIEIAFVENLINCLPDYSTEIACKVVEQAGAINNEKIVELLVARGLTFQQSFNLLQRVKSENINWPAVGALKSKLLDYVKAIESDEECLRAAIYLLASFEKKLEPKMIIDEALNRKSFVSLSFLLSCLRGIIGGNSVKFGESSSYISDDVKELLRAQVISRMDTHYNTREDALIFCHNNELFNDYANWYWYFGKYPLTKLSDLNCVRFKKNGYQGIFKEGTRRENLLSVWKATPFNRIPFELMKEYNLIIHEHPEWANVSLKKRLSYFKPDEKGDHERLLNSLAVDFERLWKEENWTVKKYIKAIERIDSYSWITDRFASLAANII